MFATLRSKIVEHGSTFDAGALTAADAVEALDDLCVVQRVVDAMVAQTIKRIEETAAHVSSGAADAAKYAATKLGVPVSQARSVLDTANALDELPATRDAVRDGRLSEPAAKLIAETASRAPGSERHLLATAEQGLGSLRKACSEVIRDSETGSERAKRQEKSQYWRMWTTPDGMVKGSFQFIPEEGGQVDAKVEGLRQKIFREHRAGKDHEAQDYYAAKAALSLLLGTADAGVKFNVHIVIDHEALRRGDVLEGERCEMLNVGTVNVDWVRSKLSDAFLTAIIQNGKDITTVAHLGRHVPAEVMTGLLVGGHECGIDECGIHGYLERDHMQDFALGGVTSLANLIWLCYFHHRLKSRGWILGPPDPTTGKRKLFPPNSKVA